MSYSSKRHSWLPFWRVFSSIPFVCRSAVLFLSFLPVVCQWKCGTRGLHPHQLCLYRNRQMKSQGEDQEWETRKFLVEVEFQMFLLVVRCWWSLHFSVGTHWWLSVKVEIECLLFAWINWLIGNVNKLFSKLVCTVSSVCKVLKNKFYTRPSDIEDTLVN